MKKTFLFFLFLITTQSAFSQDLICQVLVNNNVILKNKVSPQLNQKTLIGKSDLLSAYVTEKENHLYNIEAFLTNYDARIYSQGSLSQKTDQLTSSLWGRDEMIDISCRWVE